MDYANNRLEEMDSIVGRPPTERDPLLGGRGGGGGGGGGGGAQEHRRTGALLQTTDSYFHDGADPFEEEPRRKRGTELPSKDYDSLDYDISYNVPYKEMLRKYTKRTYTHIEVMKWVLCGIIGVLTGIVALIIDISVKELFKLKYSLFGRVYDATIGDGRVILGFVVLLAFNLVCGIIASVLVAFKPVAAGSGIPEIKCYLNGVKIPHVTRLGTIIAKAIGVLFSVAGGFLVGKEGPMIHSGAVIGAGVPQYRSLLFKWIKLPYGYFRSDRDKRDFVSSGAAAGVAAAFGAPIGGVLFSLEEGSSFWNQALTWRTLFCSFCATFSLNIFLSVYLSGNIKDFGNLSAKSLVDFGIFGKDEQHLWKAYHLIIFIAMGAVGGLLGALFNSLNTRITIYRMKYLQRRKGFWRVAEAMLISMVTTSAVFIAAMLLGTCVHTKPDATGMCPGIETGDLTFENETRDFFCPGHDVGSSSNRFYFNDLATLLFNSQETAIKQLFHQNGAFTLPTLGLLFMLYYFLSCWTYGAGIPSGLFIPCLIVGAAYGRFVATVFGYISSASPQYFGFLTNSLYAGTYSLIGAASFLGGVVRMTISLTVILIESTNEIEYGLPIMLTLMVAKWVGDMFNEGLYDIHIEVKKTPLLGWDSPRHMNRLIAEDVMKSPLVYFFPITRVRSVEQILRTTHHSAYPIVTPVDNDWAPERPKNVSEKHTPQLYTRASFIETTDMESETPEVTSPICHIQSPSARANSSAALQRSRVYSRFFPMEQGLSTSYTLPDTSSCSVGPGDDSEEGKEAKPDKLLVFHGIILRSQLIELLKNKAFFNEADGPDTQRKVDHHTLTADYPRYPNIFHITVSETERNMLMDLSLYMNPCPYTISTCAPLPQVFNLFRTMGLRHLPVLRDSGIVAGMITRHELTHEYLHDVSHTKKLKNKAKRRRNRSRQGVINDNGGSTASLDSEVFASDQ